MNIFKILKNIFKREKTKLVTEKSSIIEGENKTKKQDFIDKIRENPQDATIELSENEKKVLYIISEFKKLFKKMLIQKGCNEVEKCNSFSMLAIKTREYYPNLATKIDRVLYYYGEVPASEEKLDCLMSLYKIIKEG